MYWFDYIDNKSIFYILAGIRLNETRLPPKFLRFIIIPWKGKSFFKISFDKAFNKQLYGRYNFCVVFDSFKFFFDIVLSNKKGPF